MQKTSAKPRHPFPLEKNAIARIIPVRKVNKTYKILNKWFNENIAEDIKQARNIFLGKIADNISMIKN
ncbi:MAG: hypothetical protein WCS03_16240 [Bacteroidota bacterium]